jgi:hypothetical protein
MDRSDSGKGPADETRGTRFTRGINHEQHHGVNFGGIFDMFPSITGTFDGIFDMFPSITGTFDGITAAFTPSANGVDVRARCGSTVRDYVMANASVERVYLSKPAPTPMSYADLGSGTADTTVTPGHIGTLSGQRLKFDASATDEGIFLIPAAGGDAVKVAAVQSNLLPRELVFLVPTLTANAGYCLEVRARLNGADELRTGRLGKTLAVPSDPT